MSKIASAVIAVTLVVVAANMTYSNFHEGVCEPVKTEEKVLQVLGRVSSVFDGFSASVGFLVKDGENLKIVRYDDDSAVYRDEQYQPRYMHLVKWPNGKTLIDPITVDTFRN